MAEEVEIIDEYKRENEVDISDLYSFFKEFNIRDFDEEEDEFDIIRHYLENTDTENAFFIVDIGKIIDQYNKWCEILPRIKPHYAIKCNPNPVIINLLAKLGCNFDCASREEISQVLNCDVKPDRIIFANPCKASKQIKYARQEDIDLMTFDSISELYKIKLYHPNAGLLVRIKVDDSKSICKFNSKFGVDLSELDEIYSVAKTCRLNIIGVSFHIGSNCFDLNTYRDAVHEAKKAFEIAEKYNFRFRLLDIGGGFPADDDKIKFEDIAQIINHSINEFFSTDYPELEIISEPGRFFVSNSHTLVVNIIGKKDYVNEEGEKNFKYYLNDGIYGSFNCIHFDHATPVILPYNERDGKLYKSTVFGPTCDSMDTIAVECLLPDLAIGEWVFVNNFGAYTSAAASTFNGFQRTESFYIIAKK